MHPYEIDVTDDSLNDVIYLKWVAEAFKFYPIEESLPTGGGDLSCLERL